MAAKNKLILNDQLNAVFKKYTTKHKLELNTKLKCSKVHFAQMPSKIGAYCCDNDIRDNDSYTFDLILVKYKYHNILYLH